MARHTTSYDWTQLMPWLPIVVLFMFVALVAIYVLTAIYALVGPLFRLKTLLEDISLAAI
jgi:hypothetical protein